MCYSMRVWYMDKGRLRSRARSIRYFSNRWSTNMSWMCLRRWCWRGSYNVGSWSFWRSYWCYITICSCCTWNRGFRWRRYIRSRGRCFRWRIQVGGPVWSEIRVTVCSGDWELNGCSTILLVVWKYDNPFLVVVLGYNEFLYLYYLWWKVMEIDFEIGDEFCHGSD